MAEKGRVSLLNNTNCSGLYVVFLAFYLMRTVFGQYAVWITIATVVSEAIYFGNFKYRVSATGRLCTRDVLNQASIDNNLYNAVICYQIFNIEFSHPSSQIFKIIQGTSKNTTISRIFVVISNKQLERNKFNCFISVDMDIPLCQLTYILEKL